MYVFVYLFVCLFVYTVFPLFIYSPGEEAAWLALITLNHICFVHQQSQSPYLATH
jgi:hypothetical protein